MAGFSRENIAGFIRSISLRQIRLVCGLVLFAYLVSHFLNHALGNISMDALASGVYYHAAFWQFLPVAIAFYTAALVHTGLGISALYERRQFRWKAIEPLQLVLGLSIPALIITPIAGVRLAQTLVGHEKLYPQVLFAYWVVWPLKMWLGPAGMTHASLPGCAALPARRSCAGSDAGSTWSLSERTQHRGQRQRRMEDGESFAPPGRYAGRTGRAGPHRGLFPDRLSWPARIGAAGKGRAGRQRGPGRHNLPIV